MNEQNLRRFSPKEAREYGAQGGRRKGENFAVRRLLKDVMIEELDKPGVKEGIVTAIIKQAKSGNVKAFEVIRDTIGEKPVEKVVAAGIDPDVMREVEELVNAHRTA